MEQTITLTADQRRLLAVLLYDERDALTDCGCQRCRGALPESDALWEQLKDAYVPYPDHNCGW